MDIAYDGTWGYHPLVCVWPTPRSVLRLVNRSGNRPSHEGAAAEVDRALEVCCRAGFRRVLLRGDTDFSQTAHLDRWHSSGRVRFIFGYDSRPNLSATGRTTCRRGLAAAGTAAALHGPDAAAATARPGQGADGGGAGVQEITLLAGGVRGRIRVPAQCLQGDLSRWWWCARTSRVERGERVLFDEHRYFFYITNDWGPEAAEIVFTANGRCQQENLLAQLQGGVQALTAPVDNLESNWAYMVMGIGLEPESLVGVDAAGEPGRWQAKYRAEKLWVLGIEFKTFVNAFMRLPCQIVRTGRKVVYRLLSWNPWQGVFLRLVERLHGCWLW